MIRKFFRKSGLALTFAIFSTILFFLFSIVTMAIAKMSAFSYFSLLAWIFILTMSLMTFCMSDSFHGSLVKLNYPFWPFGKKVGAIHQTLASLALHRLSITFIIKHLIPRENKFLVAKSILNDSVKMTVDALSSGNFEVIKIKSHLLNYKSGREEIKNAVYVINPQIKCEESVEELFIIKRALLSFVLKKKYRKFPRRVKVLAFHY